MTNTPQTHTQIKRFSRIRQAALVNIANVYKPDPIKIAAALIWCVAIAIWGLVFYLAIQHI